MRIRVKIRKERKFEPHPSGTVEKHWVNVSDGSYFYVVKRDTGSWSHMGNLFRYLPSLRAAIQDYLEMKVNSHAASRRDYKTLRIRENIFTVKCPGN